MRHPRRSTGILLVCCVFGGVARLPAQSPMLATIVRLGLTVDSGEVAIYYTPGQLARAQQIRALAEPMLAFYKTKLGIAPKVVLAVVDSAYWTRIPALAPYPIPFVTDSPSVAVVAVNPLPANQAMALAQMPATPPMPGDAAAVIQALGRDPTRMRDLVMLSWDVLALHELGHRFSTTYGIGTPRRWISEFLANYWQLAFFSEHFPALVRYSETAAEAFPKPQQAVSYTTLADFERLRQPPALSQANYEWYQDEFGKRAKQVYALRGLEFLTQMRAAFPQNERTPLDDEEIIRRLEGVSPGWREWASTFGASRRR